MNYTRGTTGASMTTSSSRSTFSFCPLDAAAPIITKSGKFLYIQAERQCFSMSDKKDLASTSSSSSSSRIVFGNLGYTVTASGINSHVSLYLCGKPRASTNMCTGQSLVQPRLRAFCPQSPFLPLLERQRIVLLWQSQRIDLLRLRNGLLEVHAT